VGHAGARTATRLGAGGHPRLTDPLRGRLSRRRPRCTVTAVTSSPDRTTPPDAGTATRVSLVAVLMVLTLELVRAGGPLLGHALSVGVAAAGGTALVTYAVAGVAAGVLVLATGRRVTGSPDGRTVLVGVATLAVARLVVQGLSGGARYVAGLVAVVLAVAVLSLAVSFVAGRGTGGRQAALGLMLGSGLAIGLELTLGTWDAVWRHDATGWVVALVLAAGAVLLARAASTHTSTGRPRRLWTLGPFVALAAMILADPAFVAAQAGDPLREVGLVLVAGHMVAVWLLLSPHLLTSAVRVTAAVAVPVAVAGAFLLTGPIALVAVVVLQIAAAVVLVAALSTHRIARLGISGTAVAVGLVGVGLVAPLLVHLLGDQVPPGVDNAAAPVAVGVALAIGGLRRRTPTAPARAASTAPPEHLEEHPQPFRSNAVRLLAIPTVVLAVVGWWPSAAAGPVPARSRASSLVVLDWNLHHGVAPATDVDPERIARTIEAQDPDVVTLQEVSRGGVLGGGVDLATWLSYRLGMRLVYAPAADQQLGNAVLARSGLTDPVVTPLPYGSGPQRRSAVSATVTLADGTGVRVTSVQLQRGAANTPTRLDELHTLLAAMPGSGPTVIGGDLAAEPASPEINLLDGAGWASALDVAGGSGTPTFPSDHPTTRIDWVLGRGVEVASAEVVTGPRSSDHLPVVVTLSATH
jgi:endonuclease/exonuclease/phosphatase family metal-dependent hydrolase